MEITLGYTCDGVDFSIVAETLRTVGMAHHDPEVHQKAFENSHTTIFAYDGGRLVGFGRAICDDAYQAAVYDCAVWPDYQGQGIGAMIMMAILERVSHCNVILYAAVGKEGFYERLGLSRMKTGMARFMDQDKARDKGFVE